MEDEIFEQEETRNAMGYGYPEQEEKHNLIAFFRDIISKELNIKTANLEKDELGLAKLPVRTLLELSLYSDKMGMGGFSDYFMEEAQILNGTSLSKEGFLAKLAVTTQKFSETSLKKGLGGENKKKSMFGKGKSEGTPY